MSGDPAHESNDDLLSQIDDLKARMDRLMRGGTATSNSALLTGSNEASQEDPPEGANAAPPNRTRVRDLIGPAAEAPAAVRGPQRVVHFPGETSGKVGETAVPPEAPTARKPAREEQPVAEETPEPRPTVSTFQKLGSAVEEELRRDNSIPAPARKGPGLASRFGSADDLSPPAEPPEAPEPEPDGLPSKRQGGTVGIDLPARKKRNKVSVVALIWILVALVSAALAALHFTGVI